MQKLIEQVSPDNKLIEISKITVFNKETFALNVFDERIIDFFNDLSKEIFKNKEYNHIPALIALAFWLRKSNLNRIKKSNNHLLNSQDYITNPIGLVFHICPSNVDTMFLYSLSISLLIGNKNILRISKNLDNSYISYLFELINKLLKFKEYNIITKYLTIVTYEHDEEINAYFSKISDARVIWGGDDTIQLFKSFPTNPRTKDLVFADRISYSLINSSAFLSLSEIDKKELTRQFYNDSYTFDQKGCSSPQIIFIYGEKEDNDVFENEFYNLLKNISLKNYDIDIYYLASMKFNQLITDAIDDKVKNYKRDDNHVVFTEISDNVNTVQTCGGGYFYVEKINSLNEILNFINKKVQTLSYYGFDKKEIKFISSIIYGKGVDRIVPIGKALDFDYIWDGYNLLDELSCKKTVQTSQY